MFNYLVKNSKAKIKEDELKDLIRTNKLVNNSPNTFRNNSNYYIISDQKYRLGDSKYLTRNIVMNKYDKYVCEVYREERDFPHLIVENYNNTDYLIYSTFRYGIGVINLNSLSRIDSVDFDCHINGVEVGSFKLSQDKSMLLIGGILEDRCYGYLIFDFLEPLKMPYKNLAPEIRIEEAKWNNNICELTHYYEVSLVHNKKCSELTEEELNKVERMRLCFDGKWSDCYSAHYEKMNWTRGEK